MGIQERKEREKQEMRERIIEASRELFVQEGIEKTSIRAIAKKIEYSPATIYLYFKDTDELLYAVHERAFQLFLKRLKSVGHISNPMERLEEMGKEYIAFALENPEYYDLMFIMRSPMAVVLKKGEMMEASGDGDCNPWAMGGQSYQVLFDTVSECLEKGHIQAPNVHIATLMIWSYVHGTVSLVIRDRTSVFPEGMIELLLKEAFSMFSRMLRGS